VKKFYFLLLFIGFVAKSQSIYTVESTAHQMYDATTTVQYNNDDIYSAVIPLPFTFKFYDNDYQNILVSSNGYITFNTNAAGGFSEWVINSPIPNPTFATRNAIFGVFHDLYNSNAAGNYFVGTSGVAPFRKFVIVFKNVPQFSCTSITSYTEIILYETTNLIDVQVQDKPICSTWGGGNALLGILNNDGSQGLAAPNRNTGAWSASNEGWRFRTFSSLQPINYTVCNSLITGPLFSTGNLSVGILANATYFSTLADAEANINPLMNPSFLAAQLPLTIYARINNGTPTVLTLNLNVIDCQVDTDNDNVATADEDLNQDGNLANDDTDGDGIPNFLDDDDDGDLVLTNVELISLGGKTTSYLDTDADGIPNYLDIDDDGDGISSINEDYNNNGDLSDDDLNNNGIADYLDNSVLGISPTIANIYDLTVYPNPVSDKVNFKANADFQLEDVKLTSINGKIMNSKFKSLGGNVFEINTSELSTGTYLLIIKANNNFLTKKIVKN
jgi:hypothetical protein